MNGESELEVSIKMSARQAGKLFIAYNELLDAVQTRFPGETRHQTALRHIKACEAAMPPPKEPTP